MKALIVDVTYRTTPEKTNVLLFVRTEHGEPCVILKQHQPYFFIEEKDAKKIKEQTYEKTQLKTISNNKVIKVLAFHPGDVPILRHELEKEDVACYEADIVFTRRFLIDHNITNGLSFDGEPEYEEGITIYREPEIQPSLVTIIPEILAIDIETDPNGKEVYSIAIATKKTHKVIIHSKKTLEHAESVTSEKALLERFFVLLEEINPDIITGWNLINFDLRIIQDRCRKYDIPFNLGRTKNESKMHLKKGFMDTSRVTAEGRQVIDLLDWIRSQYKLTDYKLETVAQKFLKEGKRKIGHSSWKDIDRLFQNDPQELVHYNLQDAVLVLKIIDSTNILSLNLHRSALTGLMLDEIHGSISAFDCIYLKKLRQRGYVAPSVQHKEQIERIKGGYVLEPKPGIYDNVVVLDFKSLYPSIMRTFNIDPLTYGKPGITAPNGAQFAKEEGIVPEIIQELFEVRESYQKKKDEVGRYAIKILMNSFFGIMASPVCRFYNLELANAITSFAQFFIKKTAALIEAKGYVILYSDTDSCFVLVKKDPKQYGEQLQQSINIALKKFVKEEYKRESYLELEFKKEYSKLFIPKLRNSEHGAKKKYAGLCNGKLEVIGIEAARSDWTPLAKKFQETLLLEVFKKKNPTKTIQEFVKRLFNGEFDNDLVYTKHLRKNLRDYAVEAPHKKAAKKLMEAVGELESSLIQYIITTDGPEPVGHQKHPTDYNHYLNKQLKPIADSILTFFNTTFEAVVKNKDTTLSSFSTKKAQ